MGNKLKVSKTRLRSTNKKQIETNTAIDLTKTKGEKKALLHLLKSLDSKEKYNGETRITEIILKISVYQVETEPMLESRDSILELKVLFQDNKAHQLTDLINNFQKEEDELILVNSPLFFYKKEEVLKNMIYNDLWSKDAIKAILKNEHNDTIHYEIERELIIEKKTSEFESTYHSHIFFDYIQLPLLISTNDQLLKVVKNLKSHHPDEPTITYVVYGD